MELCNVWCYRVYYSILHGMGSVNIVLAVGMVLTAAAAAAAVVVVVVVLYILLLVRHDFYACT